jgi:hypothetical protein
MANISRRYLVRLGSVLPLALVASAVAQEAAKPEVKWSEANPIIREYVKKMLAATKESTGVEVTPERQLQLVDSIIARMEAQHIYAFIDP